ncbi:MAG: M23 family metallopeptidase, partial [Acidobacteria bacterium]|nr:M23 family metallopeptidase [Acidobacteriota bacterium]
VADRAQARVDGAVAHGHTMTGTQQRRSWRSLYGVSALLAALGSREQAERSRRAAQSRAGRSSSASAAPAKPATASRSSQSGRLARPTAGPVTSSFGMRHHPILGIDRLHAGLDFGGGAGAPIYAAEAGVVVRASYGNGYGTRTVIAHGGGRATVDGHQSVLLVSGGQRVERGQLIGRIGSTGLSTGPHLHSATKPEPELYGFELHPRPLTDPREHETPPPWRIELDQSEQEHDEDNDDEDDEELFHRDRGDAGAGPAFVVGRGLLLPSPSPNPVLGSGFWVVGCGTSGGARLLPSRNPKIRNGRLGGSLALPFFALPDLGFVCEGLEALTPPVIGGADTPALLC